MMQPETHRLQCRAVCLFACWTYCQSDPNRLKQTNKIFIHIDLSFVFLNLVQVLKRLPTQALQSQGGCNSQAESLLRGICTSVVVGVPQDLVPNVPRTNDSSALVSWSLISDFWDFWLEMLWSTRSVASMHHDYVDHAVPLKTAVQIHFNSRPIRFLRLRREHWQDNDDNAFPISPLLPTTPFISIPDLCHRPSARLGWA